ncbi:recombinase family protein [Croceicoccus naphthovorans]|uniref:Resolvase n=1 Tax=Croceicoccus naphthovorans TaxID=1348774 RepID=A0A0G3XG96_9SPHN|nr:recombinase family protein [Croceicoccus naphthovorans]AKM09423.1 resolvase [Croceicoccus naphthovorans]MBB3992252.1 DNA invertase Pin-like site-specific DNA recombinase [Croceicoccus naphthovorans]
MKTIRCAIYTRKSSDEGLEQDFNSLDAQREACSAYVLSQASEGWKLLPDHYDDGGLSGGTLERPALQRLLGDVREGRIDIIVVYKVDRLTRSLLDFARLVEAFDASDTSFVSVTQSFNTTTSMGRPTLNMLLSFAQFEREVTAERIRDKIAASKAKDMWMGGTPPLGYQPDGRSLAIVGDHASLIRDIYDRYRRLGNVRLVADSLVGDGISTPRRVNGKGRAFGGVAFTRGQLYTILKNPIYAGMIPHRDKVYPGNHAAIIDRDLWDAVQVQLADNVKGQRRTREANASLLAGLLVEPGGNPLIPVHTTSDNRRYRYYVSKSSHHGTAVPSTNALRLPAREIESVVKQELASLLADPFSLITRCGIEMAPVILEQITIGCEQLSIDIRRGRNARLKALLHRIIVHPDRLDLVLSPAGLIDILSIGEAEDVPNEVVFKSNVRLTRSGRAVRLVHDNGQPRIDNADATMIGLLVKGRRWWAELAKGELDVAKLARRENVNPSYLTRIARLALLSPKVTEAILAGKTRAGIDARSALAIAARSADWHEQATGFLPVSTS